MFYFAWVDSTDTAFSETDHTVEDEQVFGFTCTHAEGDFAALDIEVVNPKIGLLAPARKQWAWLSWRKPDNTVVPLFFGRLVAVPSEMVGELVKLSFTARPIDYEEQKEALAATMRVAPWYDPAWLSPEERQDPDAVLEGYSKLWHVDRVTGVLTASDVLVGEDGTVTFDGDEAFYDSLSVSYSESPARKVIVEGIVNWTQRGSGSVDITTKLLEAFEEGNTEGLYNINGDPALSEGMINIVAGDQMVKNWPKEGTGFGGGWTVGESSASLVGLPPTLPVIIGGESAYGVVRNWVNYGGEGMRTALRTIFDRSPGFVVQVIDHNGTDLGSQGIVLGHAEVEFLWIPVWRIAPRLVVDWSAERQRSETIQFEMVADVQPLLTDPAEAEIVRLNLGPADVDEHIGDVRRKRYFNTTSGRASMNNLIARARAILRYRARAIDVSFEAPFEKVIGLSCRMNGYIEDERIPGGNAAGKVKEYAFSANGDDGTLVGSVTLAATVGRDGTVVADPGDPDYCVAAYVGSDYQDFDGEVTIPTGDDVGVTLSNSYPISDDGVNMHSVNRQRYLLGIDLDGDLDTQKAEIKKFSFTTPTEVIDKASNFTSTVTVRMRPILNTSFDSTVSPTVTTLKIPRTIDLEGVV